MLIIASHFILDMACGLSSQHQAIFIKQYTGNQLWQIDGNLSSVYTLKGR